MSTTPVTPTTPTTGTTNGLPTGQSLNNMFLQLLVAQLQNQDPTSPVDPSQFVGQLAQFSELSEVTSIYTLLQGVIPATGAAGSSATGASSNAAANPAVLAANSALAASAFPAIGPGAEPLPSFASPSVASPGFASPSISALTNAISSKLQGAF